MNSACRSFPTTGLFLVGFCVAVALAGGMGIASPASAQSASAALEKLNEQKAKNSALEERIVKLEGVLNSDICKNPELAQSVLKEVQTPAPVAAAPNSAPAPATPPQQTR